MSNVKLVKKIQAKGVMGQSIKSCPDGDLFQVYGRATGTKTGESNFGEWVALKGDFLAISPLGQFRSGCVFLPEMAIEMVQSALCENDVVEFGFAIGKEASETSATGYEYTVTPLIEPVPEEDKLLLLHQKLEGKKEERKKMEGKKEEGKKEEKGEV